ncbi:MAG: DUF4058 family protein [Cyanothece sp. SIO1E1]|nr:DUF4058 family protein [Cyanothece sp. SIO1E1]
MPSPLPGMDPYLEQPAFWSSFHSRLIVAIADALAPQLRPHYYVEVETRTYTDSSEGGLLVGIPDAVVLASAAPQNPEKMRLEPTPGTEVRSQPQTVTLPIPTEIKERYLEVREVGSNAVITVLEVLSPKNKRQGRGRRLHEAKRQKILSSASHLIEIDLLRSDDPMPMQGATQMAHYHVLVSRAEQRPQATLYAVTVRNPLPEFPLPLKSPNEAVLVDLQAIFAGVYDRASYDLRIDYSQPLPPPSFSDVDQAWIESLFE